MARATSASVNVGSMEMDGMILEAEISVEEVASD